MQSTSREVVWALHYLAGLLTVQQLGRGDGSAPFLPFWSSRRSGLGRAPGLKPHLLPLIGLLLASVLILGNVLGSCPQVGPRAWVVERGF